MVDLKTREDTQQREHMSEHGPREYHLWKYFFTVLSDIRYFTFLRFINTHHAQKT